MPLYSIRNTQPAIADDAWVAPSADLIGDVRLHAQASVWFNAVIRADNSTIVIGARSSVQECSVLHCDYDAPCTVGEGCTVGHHAMLHGCTIGDRVLVGMRAMILDHAVIGNDCLVAAGAVVTRGKHFASGQLIMGSPARAVRPLTDDELAMLRTSADHYALLATEYNLGLQQVG